VRKERGTDKDIVDMIESLALGGYNIAETTRRVEAKFPETCPSDRTVAKYHRRVTPRDDSGAWSFAEASAEEAGAVLPVLAEMLERAGAGARVPANRVTVLEAAWITRLTQALPDIPPWEAYGLARRYIALTAAGAKLDDLDRVVAMTAWRDGGMRLVRAFLRGWIFTLPWSESISPEAERWLASEQEAKDQARDERHRYDGDDGPSDADDDGRDGDE
jgi:hypothetical protein